MSAHYSMTVTWASRDEALKWGPAVRDLLDKMAQARTTWLEVQALARKQKLSSIDEFVTGVFQQHPLAPLDRWLRDHHSYVFDVLDLPKWDGQASFAYLSGLLESPVHDAKLNDGFYFYYHDDGALTFGGEVVGFADWSPLARAIQHRFAADQVRWSPS